MSPKAAFTKQEVIDWTRRFIEEAAFSEEGIELVFGQGLIEILTRPEFVRTRMEILGVDDAPTKFRPYRSKVGPDEGRLGSGFVPTYEDFGEGRLHRPEIANRVDALLEQDRLALVKGVGASGKSVLAWLLAIERAEKRIPSYYLDIASDPTLAQNEPNTVINDLIRFGHSDVLFVLDNIHIEEAFTKEVLAGWNEIAPSNRPQLLLIGRETRSGLGSPIESLKITPLVLRARQAELRGVNQRLALRQSLDQGVPAPPRGSIKRLASNLWR